MGLFKPKKIYLDQYSVIREFPAGLFEIYTPSTEAGAGNLLISPLFAGKVLWKKRHTMVRFYIFGRGFVVCWKTEPSDRVFMAKNGLISLGIGKLVINSFPPIKKEKRS